MLTLVLRQLQDACLFGGAAGPMDCSETGRARRFLKRLGIPSSHPFYIRREQLRDGRPNPSWIWLRDRQWRGIGASDYHRELKRRRRLIPQDEVYLDVLGIRDLVSATQTSDYPRAALEAAERIVRDRLSDHVRDGLMSHAAAERLTRRWCRCATRIATASEALAPPHQVGGVEYPRGRVNESAIVREVPAYQHHFERAQLIYQENGLPSDALWYVPDGDGWAVADEQTPGAVARSDLWRGRFPRGSAPALAGDFLELWQPGHRNGIVSEVQSRLASLQTRIPEETRWLRMLAKGAILAGMMVEYRFRKIEDQLGEDWEGAPTTFPARPRQPRASGPKSQREYADQFWSALAGLCRDRGAARPTADDVLAALKEWAKLAYGLTDQEADGLTSTGDFKLRSLPKLSGARRSELNDKLRRRGFPVQKNLEPYKPGQNLDADSALSKVKGQLGP